MTLGNRVRRDARIETSAVHVRESSTSNKRRCSQTTAGEHRRATERHTHFGSTRRTSDQAKRRRVVPRAGGRVVRLLEPGTPLSRPGAGGPPYRPAVIRYLDATGDDAFAASVGLELLVETARLWASLGHHDPAGEFRIDGVTGPDEYSAIADNNVYTNLMAQQNLRAAAEYANRHPEQAGDLGIDEEEMARWRDAAEAMFIPYDGPLGIHPQSEGFTRHQIWDFAATPPEQYPLLLHFPYFDLYRKQVIKQADLVLAMHRCPDAFTPEQKAANFAYYERLTVRDSSLSAGIQAVLAAETGHLQLAYDYLAEAAFMDLDDLEHNTRDGLHMAALAGSWIALICGLAGMRHHNTTLSFAPRLPPRLTRLAFKITLRGDRSLGVEVTAAAATYTLLADTPMAITHHRQPITVSPGTPSVAPIPTPSKPSPAPTQPPGREPARHRHSATDDSHSIRDRSVADVSEYVEEVD